MNTVVVGYTVSDSAARALARAADLAEAFRARLVVVSVSRPAAVPVVEPAVAQVTAVPPAGVLARMPQLPAVPPDPDTAPSPEDLSRAQLEHARAYLARRDVEAEYVAEVGDPADRLLGIADEQDADVIVVGSREHGLLGRLLGAHVDDKVARHAHRDLLLVH